jgi:hypothetical protein
MIPIFIAFVSCELFLAPKSSRNNPNDPDNPVQPALNFQAVGVSSTEILLTFVVPSPEDEEKIPSGYIIVKSPDGTPGWFDEGTVVIEENDAAFTAGDVVSFTDADEAFEPGKEYWYTLWVHGSGDLADHYTHSGTNSAFAEGPPVFARLDVSGAHYVARGYADEGAFVEWYYPSGSDIPPGHFITRYEGVVTPSDPYAGHGFPVQGDWRLDDWGLEPEKWYTYAIYPADHDGSPYPNSGTPVYDTASTNLLSARLDATQDAWIDEGGGQDGYSASMTVTMVWPASYVLINFDPSGITNFGWLADAELVLKTTSTAVTPGFITVKRMSSADDGWNWDEGFLPWGYDIHTGWYVDDGTAPSTYVDFPSTGYQWNVTDLVWRMIEEGSFNGFALLPDSPSDLAVEFDTRESSGYGGSIPVLDIQYYED